MGLEERGRLVAKTLGATAVVGTSILVGSSPAGAIYAPFNNLKADNREHTYISTESDSSLRSEWHNYFDTAINAQWADKTVLYSNELSSDSTSVDLY